MRKIWLGLVATVALFVAPAAFAIDPVNTTLLGDLAIDGYDAVAYFTDGKPIEGKKEHSFEWNGATWRFASAEHRTMFAKSPERYAPQYGGYCAWAVGHGYTAGADPTVWTIRNGKLYLNYNQDVQKKWNGDIPGWISKGDVNWPKILQEKK